MARAAQIYKFDLAAGASSVMLVEGGFYKVLSASGTIKVSREGGSAIGPILPGQGEREDFKRLTINNTSGAANAGFILIADRSFEDTRVYGEVSVIDGELARSKNGTAFWGFSSPGPVAGTYPCGELWNPVGTGRRVIVRDIAFSTLGAAGVGQYSLTRTTANQFGVGAVNAKSSAMAVSLAGRIGQGNPVAIPGFSAELAYVLANTLLARTYIPPIICEPGAGLIISNNQAGSQMLSMFQFTEEEI